MGETEAGRNRAGAPRRSRPVLAVFTSHWLAMVGLGLVLTAIVLWICLMSIELRHGDENPYVGLATTAVGCILVLGAFLAPIGLHLGRRRVESRLAAALDDRRTVWIRLIAFLVVTSLLNVLIASQTSPGACS